MVGRRSLAAIRSARPGPHKRPSAGLWVHCRVFHSRSHLGHSHVSAIAGCFDSGHVGRWPRWARRASRPGPCLAARTAGQEPSPSARSASDDIANPWGSSDKRSDRVASLQFLGPKSQWSGGGEPKPAPRAATKRGQAVDRHPGLSLLNRAVRLAAPVHQRREWPWPRLILLPVLIGFVIGFSIRARKLLVDILAGRVSVATGTLVKGTGESILAFSFLLTANPAKYDVLELGHLKFRAPARVAHNLPDRFHGRAFYTPRSKQLLAVEVFEPPGHPEP